MRRDIWEDALWICRNSVNKCFLSLDSLSFYFISEDEDTDTDINNLQKKNTNGAKA